jgi:hypothetical protein
VVYHVAVVEESTRAAGACDAPPTVRHMSGCLTWPRVRGGSGAGRELGCHPRPYSCTMRSAIFREALTQGRRGGWCSLVFQRPGRGEIPARECLGLWLRGRVLTSASRPTSCAGYCMEYHGRRALLTHQNVGTIAIGCWLPRGTRGRNWRGASTNLLLIMFVTARNARAN